MTNTSSTVATIAPLTHEEAMRLQAHEMDRTLALLRSLGDADWMAPTDCPAWDVTAMYRHVLGACEAGASMRENIHQLRKARSYRKHHGGPLEAALSTVQVNERNDLIPAQIVARLAETTSKTVRSRTRIPAFLRNHAKMAVDGPVFETWTLGYLTDKIYLRDLWMHRVDVAYAINQPVELTAEHDGRIVADVVAEWSRRHGKAFRLDLTGPAGGIYTHDEHLEEAEHFSTDALHFCRTLAGREPATGLLATVVPF